MDFWLIPLVFLAVVVLVALLKSFGINQEYQRGVLFTWRGAFCRCCATPLTPAVAQSHPRVAHGCGVSRQRHAVSFLLPAAVCR